MKKAEKTEEEAKEIIEEIRLRSILSQNIKKLREDAMMSQTKLAEKAGVANNFISDIENGRKWVSATTLARLCIALKVEPHLFFVARQKYTDKGAEMFLDDISDSFEKLMKQYRNRIQTDTDDDKELEKKEN